MLFILIGNMVLSGEEVQTMVKIMVLDGKDNEINE
jgi:hypothetical protein